MTPQEIHKELWIARTALEEIYLNSHRVVAEMRQSDKVSFAIEAAFEFTEQALVAICDEYIWDLQDQEEEAKKNEIK